MQDVAVDLAGEEAHRRRADEARHEEVHRLVVQPPRAGDLLEHAAAQHGHWLGGVLYAYVPYEVDERVRGKLEELDRELDGEGMRSQLVVALDAMSPTRDGDTAELWIDPANIHVFDPESGDNLTRDEARAAALEADAKRQRERALERARRRTEGQSVGT